MATRANVKIELPTWGENSKPHIIWLYHHWDGYPSGLGRTIIQSMIQNKVSGDRDIFNVLAKAETPGFEFTNDMHGDIEYLYIIKPGQKSHRDDSQVTVLEVHTVKHDYSDENKPAKTTCIKSIEFNPNDNYTEARNMLSNEMFTD